MTLLPRRMDKGTYDCAEPEAMPRLPDDCVEPEATPNERHRQRLRVYIISIATTARGEPGALDAIDNGSTSTTTTNALPLVIDRKGRLMPFILFFSVLHPTDGHGRRRTCDGRPVKTWRPKLEIHLSPATERCTQDEEGDNMVPHERYLRRGCRYC